MMEQERIDKAVALFKEGFNCSQSVVAAFADKYGFTQEQALRMSASFGGGIGRMRETCGAACGLFMLAVWKRGLRKVPIKKGRRLTISWYKNWQQSSSRETEPCVVPICWDYQKMSQSFLHRKPVLINTMPSVRV